MSHMKKYNFWQAGWWHQDHRRGQRLVAGVMLFCLLGLAAMTLPGVQENITAWLGIEQIEDVDVPPLELENAKNGENPLPAEQEPPQDEGRTENDQPVQQVDGSTSGSSNNNDGEALPVVGSVFSISLSAAIPGSTVSRSYGYDYNPNTGDYRFHRGCDVVAELEAEVYAPLGGTVSEAYADAYWGGIVVLDHGDGWKSIYKCIIPAVQEGDSVEKGQLLGQITRAPAEAAQDYHLHVEVEQNDASRDPAYYW